MEEQEAILCRVHGVAEQLLDRLEKAVRELDAVSVTHREKEKTDRGECIREYTEKLPRRRGMVDRGGLKQLTGVLKDLQEILCWDPTLSGREREARLLRLEQELELRENTEGITVILQGEAERYAE